MKLKPSIVTLVAIVTVVIIGVGAYALFSSNDEGNKSVESKNCTTYNNTVGQQCAENYEGLPISEAVDKAEDNGLQPVITVVDRENQGFTDIFRGAPIYFEVTGGVVTKAFFEDDRSQ